MLSLELLLLIVLVGVLYLFWDSHLKAREHAIMLSQRYCQQQNMQLLDQTVGLHRFRIARRGDGRLQLQRVFRFEFSSDGLDRRSGWILMAANRAISAYMELPDGATWLSEPKAEVTRIH